MKQKLQALFKVMLQDLPLVVQQCDSRGAHQQYTQAFHESSPPSNGAPYGGGGGGGGGEGGYKNAVDRSTFMLHVDIII